MKYLQYLFIIICCISVTTIQGQISKVDSWSQLLDQHTKNDSVKAHLMVSLATMLAYSNPGKSIKIIDAELPLTETLHYNKGILDGYNVKTSLLIIQ